MKKNFLLLLLLGVSSLTFAQLGTPTISAPANGATYYVGSTISFSWTSVTDALSYDVEFDAGTGYSFSANVVGTGYDMTLAVSNTGPHTWHVRAKNASVTGLWSTSQSYSVIGIPGVPTTVNPANASNITYNTATNFTWNAVTNATGYKIQFDNDAPIVVSGTTYPKTFTSLGSHTWKVLASNPAGESGWSTSKTLTVVLGTPSLTSPANTFRAYVGSTLNFSWTPVGGATSYEIELDPGLGYATLSNVSGTTLNFLLSASAVGSHSWHVRAKNGPSIGNWSATRSYTVVGIPAVPTTNTPQNGATINFGLNTNFTWNNVATATSYQIQFDNDAPITVSGTAYSRSFNTFGIHTWKVLASNDAGDSGWSSVRTITIALAAPPLNSPSNGSTAYDGSNLDFSWTSIPGATTYDIEFDEGLGSATLINVPTVSYIKALTTSYVGQHTWHVRGVAGSTIGQWSQTRTFIVAGVPAIPTNLNPATESTVTYEIAANFTWNTVQYATSYQIQFDSEVPLTVSNSSYSRTFNTLGNHTWKVKAINAAGESGWSVVNNFTVVLGIPLLSSPANANTFYVGETASFSWSSVAGATSYDVEFDAGLGTVTQSNVAGISMNVTLVANQAGTHTWHVRAKNGAVLGGWSATRSITIIGIPVVPTTTTPASGSSIFYDAATAFSWNAVQNATSYKIQFDSETPITVTGTSYTRTYSSFGSHTWKVLASNDAGDSGWSSSKTFTVALGIPAMSAPANGSTAYINTNLNFTWTSVAGATSYDIEFDTGLGSVSLSNVVVTSKQWALVAANVGNHTWRVRARNSNSVGLWTQTRTFTVAGIPAIPVTTNPPPEGTVPYNTPAFFAWNAVQNATSYKIQFDSEVPISVTGTNFPRTFSDLSAHTWKVKAVNAAGESGWSTVKNFTVILGTPNLTSPANASTQYVGTTLEFSWTSVSGATSYDIEFDAGLGYAYLTNVSGNTFNLPLTVANVGPHTWHVRAKLNTSTGSWSVNRSFTVAGIPGVPVLVRPTNGSSVSSEQNVQFNWNGVANASSYKIQFDTEAPIVVSGTSYTRSFSAFGNHTWTVQASNDAGDSDWSAAFAFTVDFGIPTLTSPANASVYYVGSTINFSWTPVTGATSYDVEFDAGLGYVSLTNVSVASLNVLLTNIHAGPHTWHVRAKNNAFTGSWSQSRNYQVYGIPSVPVLMAPTDGSTIPFNTAFNFTWGQVSNATGYQIQFDSETPINVSGTSYSSSFNTPGNHTWKVLATNAAGKSDWSNINTFSPALDVPTLNTPANDAKFNSGATIDFSWTPVTGATSYDIELDGGTTNATLTNVAVTNMNLVTTISSAGQHTWHVRARQNATTGTWSASGSYTVYTIPSIPVQVTPAENESLPCNTSYNFTWNAVTGATAYKIQFDADLPVTVTGTSYSKSFSTTGPHTWKILASNSAGESAWSSARPFSVDLGIPNLSSPVNAFTFFVGSSISFSWTSTACANSYDIEVDAGTPSASLMNVIGNSVNLQTDGTSVGSHTWHVRGKLNAAIGQWSATQTYSVLGLPAVPVLNSPANASTLYSESASVFTWNAVANASGYQIQFDTETPVTVTGTTYSRTFNTAGNHTWKVLATNAAGSSDWSTARAFTYFIGSPIVQTRVLVVTPDESWNYGTVTVNNTNTKILSLQNTGNAVLKVTSLALSGANSNQYNISDPLITNFDIVPGGSVQISIGFKPTSEGLQSASLVISSNADNATPSKSISLNGTGTLLQTKTLSVSPDVLYDFGNVVINGTADESFTVQNNGTASLSIAALSLSGINADQYAIVYPLIPSFMLSPGDNQKITVRFRPTATGAKTTNLVVTNNSDNASPSKQITLNGTGTAVPVIVPPLVSTGAVSGITSSSAIGGGDVSSDGGGIVTAKGLCWSTTINPTISDSKTSDGSGMGVFTTNLTGLSAGTTYHIRSYATNSAGTSYGADVQFTTLAFATITTVQVTSINAATAVSGGNITSDGGAAVTARGVCWGTLSNPTISDSKTSDGTGTGSFASNLTGLSAGTIYHVRSYATNSAGTSYGADLQFTTLAMASVTTVPVTSITSSTAIGGGNVTSDGGAPVTARGSCWSTKANPALSDSKTSDGTGTGVFSSNLTGLVAGTTYHVRSYATNAVGTSYGADLIFVTPAPATVTTVSVLTTSSSAALGKGDITSDGGAQIIQKGLCWSLAANPTISDAKTTDGTGTGSFSDLISGLSPGTTYNVRAYATNSAGTSYGANIQFTTYSLATVVSISATASENPSTTATGKGNVTSDGGTTVTEKGFCWGLSANPTVGDARTTEGTGIGNFSDIITGLTPGTTYHVRAYAINAVGTSYGADLSFITSVNNGVYNITDFYQIYPNPSRGNITIKSKEDIPFEMTIYTPEGNLLGESKLTNQITNMDLNLPKGVYLVVLKSGKATGSYRLIIL
ncbi:MAG: choice-of-anchor D domain-containing protein [Prolixibacteraceae bacterium]|nr:choice-of-anchor D domain-containing protein [Prolixibacteraceae bacterium]